MRNLLYYWCFGAVANPKILAENYNKLPPMKRAVMKVLFPQIAEMAKHLREHSNTSSENE